ncbi:MAG: hypothetical protein ACI9L7_001089 [Candidatus Azotimanducaceae bacterium]|jgi:hypothetical protein
MKFPRIFLLTISFLFGLNTSSFAQCDFDPTVTVSPQDDDGIYCPGDVLTLSTQESDSYQWFYNFSNNNSGGNAVSGGTTQSIELGASEWAVVYFYVESTINGCAEASPTVVWDGWVFNNPAVSHPAILTYCEGEEILISNAFPGPTTFQWYQNGNPIDGATDEDYFVTESGTYVLNVTYPTCPDFELTSGIGPTFSFIATEIPVLTESGGSISSTSATSYEWYLNGEAIIGANEQSYIPTESGEYFVAIIDSNGCEAQSDPLDFVLVGVPEIKESALSIFPNPVNGHLNLISNDKPLGQILIYDALGQKVFVDVINDINTTIDFSIFNTGLYYLVLPEHNHRESFLSN